VPEVIINARAAARRQLSGVERWAVELAERLPRLRPSAYAVARPPGALAYRAGQAWEQLALPVRARREGAPLVLSPANLAPLSFGGNVVVVHDAVALSHPEWFSRPYAAYHRRVLPLVVRRARRVVTVSSFSRDELRRYTGVEATVVPGGVDERFRPDADRGRVREELGLSRGYVLCVAGESPRKNFAALAVVGAALRALGVELVTAGSARAHHGARSSLPAVRSLGYVPDDLLPGLYAGALCFVLPSFHEGFGLPCVEAMACGTPVVASSAGALPETCGDAAVLVDPSRADDVARGVLSVLREPDLAARLRASGLVRAASFTWERTASQIDEILAAEARTL
jgi:glycosyltransferase involved in cell wall biosynthesis